jgi:hypothetical protein
MRISVVGTVHEASGLANARELQAILARLRPDVIFAEIPPAHVDEYVAGSRGTLESIAVRDYREGSTIAVVPVDLPEPDGGFFADAKDLFAAIERTSSDYRRMMDQHSSDTRVRGFPYLNSSLCIQAWAGIYGEIRATVEWIGVNRFREIYERWVRANERRDAEMLRNIEGYCTRHVFEHSVFLVGASHRGSIRDMAHNSTLADSSTVQWHFEGIVD